MKTLQTASGSSSSVLAQAASISSSYFVLGGGEFLESGLFAHDVARLGGVGEEVVGGDELVQLGQTLTFFGDERREIHKTKNGDRPRGGAITG